MSTTEIVSPPIPFTVQASQAWQNTGINVQADTALTIAYQFGVWTADPQTNNGNLYNAAGCPGIIVSQPLYPLEGVNMGALVGRINGGTPFLVGNGPVSIPSGQNGLLELCINDDLTGAYGAGLADNSGSVTLFIYNTNTLPNTAIPLISEPAQTYPAAPTAVLLGPLQYLVGTWTNQNLAGTGKGDPNAPYSYNVMPLPQIDPSSSTGYILKNFSYYEELTFSSIHGNAPNRGGSGTQVANTLFYEQRVYFAEGPNKDALVHAENGSLLFLTDQPQALGPYGNGDLPGLGNQIIQNNMVPTQPFNIVKQVSVPHGNSILAPGNYVQATNGVPQIPVVSTLPTSPVSPINTAQYTVTDPVTNPNPTYTLNPNQALADALAVNQPTSYIRLDVGTQNGGGGVNNIGFEQHYAQVSLYDCTYWIEALNNSQNFTQLQYSQTITLQIPIADKGVVSFPHITTNTLTKVANS